MRRSVCIENLLKRVNWWLPFENWGVWNLITRGRLSKCVMPTLLNDSVPRWRKCATNLFLLTLLDEWKHRRRICRNSFELRQVPIQDARCWVNAEAFFPYSLPPFPPLEAWLEILLPVPHAETKHSISQPCIKSSWISDFIAIEPCVWWVQVIPGKRPLF